MNSWLALRRMAFGGLIAGGVLLTLLGVAGVVSLIVFVAIAVALATAFAPWAALAYGGYVLVRQRRRRHARRHGYAYGGRWAASWPSIPAAQQRSGPVAAPATAVPAVPAVPADPMARLPEDLRAKAECIRRKAQALLQDTDRFPAGSRDLYLVQRTLSEYLPSTLQAYQALPRGSDDWPLAPDGRSGLQVLRDQLDILEAKLDEVSGDLWRRNAQQLLANERFLEQHVGRRQPEELTIPGR